MRGCNTKLQKLCIPKFLALTVKSFEASIIDQKHFLPASPPGSRSEPPGGRKRPRPSSGTGSSLLAEFQPGKGFTFNKSFIGEREKWSRNMSHDIEYF